MNVLPRSPTPPDLLHQAAPRLLEALLRLTEIADERPFVQLGHVIEHELPEVRELVATALGETP